MTTIKFFNLSKTLEELFSRFDTTQLPYPGDLPNKRTLGLYKYTNTYIFETKLIRLSRTTNTPTIDAGDKQFNSQIFKLVIHYYCFGKSFEVNS